VLHLLATKSLTVGLLAFYAVVAALVVLLFVRGARGLRKSRVRGSLGLLGGAFGIAFAILTTLTLRLPTQRNAPFRINEELVRFGALGVGVVFLLAALAAILPLVLDLLEQRGFSSFVGARHVRATKSGFLTAISILSMAGVGVSSCSLCSVTSIMGGFGHDLKRKILGNNAHIVVDVTRPGGFADWDEKLTAIRVALAKTRGAATPIVGGEAMASSASNTAGALVRGIDPETIGTVIDLRENINQEAGGVGSFDYFVHPEKLLDLGPDEIIGRGPAGEPYFKGPDFRLSPDIDPSLRAFLRAADRVLPGVILGKELAKSLHVLVGDEVTLLSPIGELGPMGMMPRSRKFRVAAIFYSGMYEYDATHAYIELSEAQVFFGLNNGDRITQIDVRVPDPERVGPAREAVETTVADLTLNAGKGAKIRVRDWMEMNKNLFSALKLERIATFIILSLAIMVASFCIVCTLLLMVTEKGKEIAILKAIGASDSAIMKVFMIEGVIIGAIGTAFGVGTAFATCMGLSWFGVRLNPDVYYIDRLPVNVDPADYAVVALAALTICTVSTIYPAFAASELRPVDGLRWE
jgi:lipoprotein-releasing system permease protein